MQFTSLLENPFFRHRPLNEEDMAALAELSFVPKRYPAHSAITHDGDVENRLRVIHSGWTCLQKLMPDGERQIIDFPLPGDVVGFGSHIRNTSTSLVSVSETLVFESTGAQPTSTISRSPSLSRLFLDSTQRQELIVEERLASLGRRSALVRTGHLLLELGVRTSPGLPLPLRSYECPLTQYDLADALGLSPIHVNRMLRELREETLLSFRQGTVEFLDYEGLVALTGFDESFLGYPDWETEQYPHKIEEI